jgi:glucose/arabinose dehydrogenase
MKPIKRSVVAATAAVLAALSLSATASAATTTVVATGLNNPRQLSMDAQGNLYVAEAGRAGKQCPSKDTCFGTTSAIAKIPAGGGAVQRIVTGFPSGGGKDGSFATGIDGVSVAPDGTVFGLTTSGPPSQLKGIPKAIKRKLGVLFSVPAAGGTATTVAKVDTYEIKKNPDKTDVNPNPYAVLGLASNHAIVVDAGGNTVYDVNNGQQTLLAILPKNKGRQSVPISIALGPDGAYYVGELPGEGKRPRPHQARIFKIVPGQKPTVFATGLDGVAGLAFGPDGSLYATELMTSNANKPTGDVVKIAPDGTKTHLFKGLGFPAGIAVGQDGSLYVSLFSILPGRTPKKGQFKGLGGQVVKLTP